MNRARSRFVIAAFGKPHIFQRKADMGHEMCGTTVREPRDSAISKEPAARPG
jgi:hypothetical protein